MNELEREMAMLEGIDLSQTPANATPVNTTVQQTVPVDNAQLQAQANVVQTTQTAVQPTVNVQTPIQPVQPQQYAQPMQTLNLDVAQQQTDETDYLTLTMGKKVSTSVFEKFKGQKDERKLVIVLDPFFDDPAKAGQVMAIKKHYSEDGLGSFLCFGKECCQYESKATVNYLFPVLEVPIINGDITKPIPTTMGGHLKLKLLAAGNTLYSQLADVYAANGNTFEGIDLVMTCTEAQYQNFTVQPTRTTVREMYAADLQAAKQKWLASRNQAYTVVARKIDPEYYRDQKGLSFTGTMVSNETAPGIDQVLNG